MMFLKNGHISETSCKGTQSWIFIGPAGSYGWKDGLWICGPGIACSVGFIPWPLKWFSDHKACSVTYSLGLNWKEKGKGCALSALSAGQELMWKEPKKPWVLLLERPLNQDIVTLPAAAFILIPHRSLAPISPFQASYPCWHCELGLTLWESNSNTQLLLYTQKMYI